MENKQPKVFLKLSDLTDVYVEEGKAIQEFIALPIKLLRSFNKVSGTEQVSMVLTIHKPQLQQIRLKNGNDYITAALFHRILLKAKAKYVDEQDRPVNEWNFNVLCRFVQGTYTNRDGVWSALEVVFKKGVYITHFFDNDTIAVFDLLKEQKQFTVNWITRPDAIQFVETIENLDF